MAVIDFGTMNDLVRRLRPLIDPRRLVDTAVGMIATPSPTGNAGEVADWLADRLVGEGFAVKRHDADHPSAPAVAVRLDSGEPGPVIQFDGHLDTVHLRFVPPGVAGGRITGSGAADMKGGLAAAIEAMRVVRDSGRLTAGSLLFTAHDLHESPWGDGRQLDALIRAGVVGDAVLIPEPLSKTLPVLGRGQAIWRATVRRPGPPVHEVMRPRDEPSVISAAGRLIRELDRLATVLGAEPDAFDADPTVHPGKASVFIGQLHSGEIYNQYPQVCRLEGTRRWLPGADRSAVERELRSLLGRVAEESGASIDCEWILTRDAFRLDPSHEVVAAFESAYEATAGRRLPHGPKPFVDDGNSFWALAGVPAITHGPDAAGQHTVNEWVDARDLERVALLYATTALSFCVGETSE